MHQPILVADDSADDAFLLERALMKAGITVPVVFVRDGEEAIRYLGGQGEFADRVAHPLPGLLLLDLKMPRLNGFDVLEWLQKQPALRRLVAIVMSSSSAPQDVDRAYDLGANSYLTKPSSAGDYVTLAERLRAYWLESNRAPQCDGENS